MKMMEKYLHIPPNSVTDSSSVSLEFLVLYTMEISLVYLMLYVKQQIDLGGGMLNLSMTWI